MVTLKVTLAMVATVVMLTVQTIYAQQQQNQQLSCEELLETAQGWQGELFMAAQIRESNVRKQLKGKVDTLQKIIEGKDREIAELKGKLNVTSGNDNVADSKNSASDVTVDTGSDSKKVE